LNALAGVYEIEKTKTIIRIADGMNEMQARLIGDVFNLLDKNWISKFLSTT
jgi:hypothetical protein